MDFDSLEGRVITLQEQISEYQRREEEKNQKLKDYERELRDFGDGNTTMMKALNTLQLRDDRRCKDITDMFKRQLSVEGEVRDLLKTDHPERLSLSRETLQSWADKLSMTAEDRARFERIKK